MVMIINLATFLLLILSSSSTTTTFGLPAPVTTYLTVDQSSTAPSGDNRIFSTLQAAIDSIVPSTDYVAWTHITIASGLYREQVTIPQNKPCIYLQGSGETTTRVEWNLGGDINHGSTFTTLADNIIVSNITLVNTYNLPPSQNPRHQAVAARVSGDKTSFYGVTFLSVQDTLYDDHGRHYFHSCTIHGAVDFIFGAGQSIYQNCTIVVTEPGGAITAQGRLHPEDSNGFVFRECSVVGTGPTLLGRAWKPYSRTLFIQTYLADIIDPAGWGNWDHDVNDITFGEYNCSGPGSNTQGRVPWEQIVTPTMLDTLGTIDYVDSDGWIANQPGGITPENDVTMQYDNNQGSVAVGSLASLIGVVFYMFV